MTDMPECCDHSAIRARQLGEEWAREALATIEKALERVERKERRLLPQLDEVYRDLLREQWERDFAFVRMQGDAYREIYERGAVRNARSGR